MRNPLKRLVTRVGTEDPLALAHHPTCEYYSHHVMTVYGQKLCMGCFVVYPVGFLSLVTLLGLRMTPVGGAFAAIPTATVHAAGVALLVPKVAMKIAPGRRTRTARILAKAVLAAGLALVAFPLFFRPGARLPTLALFFGFLLPYVGYKAYTATDDCQGCPEADDFPHCSGMSFDGTYSYPDANEGGPE